MRGNLMLRPQTTSVGIPPSLQVSHRHQRHRSLVVNAVTSSSASRLRDPARIGGSSSYTIPVHDYGGAQSLDKYMHLPPSHYSTLDPHLIESLGGNTNKFRLHVPRVTLFSLWIEPTVDICVSSANARNPRVLLTSEGCHLVGSDLVQRMQLDKRFTLSFSTELTWKTTPSRLELPVTSTTTSEIKLPTSQITGNLQLEVLTEVIPPFHLLPRKVLEGTCNAVLRGLMKTLLPKFMRRLADDYTKWATESEYRRGRTAKEEDRGLTTK